MLTSSNEPLSGPVERHDVCVSPFISCQGDRQSGAGGRGGGLCMGQLVRLQHAQYIAIYLLCMCTGEAVAGNNGCGAPGAL